MRICTIFGTETGHQWNKIILTVPTFWHINSLNMLFILSGISAIGLITFYSFTFTRELKGQVVRLREKEGVSDRNPARAGRRPS